MALNHWCRFIIQRRFGVWSSGVEICGRWHKDKVIKMNGQLNHFNTHTRHCSTLENDNSKWHPRTIEMTSSCGEGIKFKTMYIDTEAGLSYDKQKNIPTLLCIQGSGATHKDYIPIMKPFAEEHGFRAVCFDWPGERHP